MQDGGGRDDLDWVELTTVQNSSQVNEILDLLAQARVPTRLVRHGGDDPDPSPLAGAWDIEVPAAELPVAAGVVDHFLEHFRHRPEGDADPAEVLAALDAPADPEFAAAVARARSRRERTRLFVFLFSAIGLPLVYWLIASLR